jgi:four helix bundle protein
MSGSNYRDLQVWQKAMDLAEEVYVHIKKLPREEKYELSSQIRRAAVSIPSNIAEGQVRFSTKEFLNFLSIARGSNAELQTQLLLCGRFGYLDEVSVDKLLSSSYEIDKMICSLVGYLETKVNQ